jgi:recombinational DNA repair protein RecR
MEETLLIKQQENERLQAKVAELENKLAHCANCEQLQTKQAETDQLNKQVMAQISTLKEAIQDFKERESLNKQLL